MRRTLAMIAAIGLLGPFSAVGICSDAQQKPRLITVTGEAEVKVVPDEVVVTIGVDKAGPDLDRCKGENDGATKKVLAAARDLGIDPKGIQTSHFNIWTCDYCDATTKEKYGVSKTIVITVRDVSKMEDLVSAALKAGANGIRGISFQTTELRKHRDEARLLALRAAKEKAVLMTGVLDEKIGRPYEIQELKSETVNWYDYWWWGARRAGQSQNVVQDAGGGSSRSSEGALAPGQVSVRATVSVSFELE